MTLKIEDIAYMNVEGLDGFRLQKTLESPLTTIVTVGTAAATVAQVADERPRGGVVVIVSPTRKPLGVLSPKWLSDAYLSSYSKSLTLREAIDAIEKLELGSQGGFLGGITRQYLGRPPDVYCEAGDHYADENPCSHHR